MRLRLRLVLCFALVDVVVLVDRQTGRQADRPGAFCAKKVEAYCGVWGPGGFGVPEGDLCN